jgi:hypothetical protein
MRRLPTLALAENGVPMEMWIDDVAASLNRLGCGP